MWWNIIRNPAKPGQIKVDQTPYATKEEAIARANDLLTCAGLENCEVGIFEADSMSDACEQACGGNKNKN